VVTESTSTDAETGELLVTCRNATFIRGAGGFGGDPRPVTGVGGRPERDPDFLAPRSRSRRDQALLYRLTGDTNPLHADPEFAKKAGFDRPILHGMCTYGYTARILLQEACGFPGRALHPRCPGRFASPGLPRRHHHRRGLGRRAGGVLPHPSQRIDRHRTHGVLRRSTD